MGTTSLTTQHAQAVPLLARGLTEPEITTQLKVDANQLLREVSQAWRVTNPSAIAAVFAGRLSYAERLAWKRWAAGFYARLRPVSLSQRRLWAALHASETASLSLPALARELGTTETALNGDIGRLLVPVPSIKTRAGLVMACLLSDFAGSQPHAVIDGLPTPTLTDPEVNIMRLIARGYSDEDMHEALGFTSLATTKRLSRDLLEKFRLPQAPSANRGRLALIYVLRYQPLRERIQWQNEVTFQWPTPDEREARKLLHLKLTWQHCDASSAQLSTLIGVSKRKVDELQWQLLDRLSGWVPNRFNVITAAELHRPR